MDNFYARYSGLGGSGGVSSINTVTGALTLVGANGVTITNVGTAFTITGTGGTVTSFSFTNGGGFTGTVTNPTTTPALSLVGILSGDITGPLTATALTATTNSTLTSLPSLILPGSQVSGNITGTASNITATSNSTLTTLSALSLPATQVTGLSSLYATTTLNNLGTTAINAALLPAANNTINIGSNALGFSNVYGSSFNIVDNSGGYGGVAATIGQYNQASGFFPTDLYITTPSESNRTGRMLFFTGNNTGSGNSGDFIFQAGNAGSGGTLGSFQVTCSAVTFTASSISLETQYGPAVVINDAGAATFQAPNGATLATGRGETVLLTTGIPTAGESGNAVVSTGVTNSAFEFVVTSFSGTIVAGDVYSVGGVNYTFIYNYNNDFYFSSSAAGIPPVSGTLTKVTSAGGPATIPYSSASQNTTTSGATYITTGNSGPYANTGNIYIAPGTPGTSGVQGSVFIQSPTLDLTGTNVLKLASTVTPLGTDGAQTINKASGTVNFAPAATSLTVTNSLVTANSLVFATIRTNDATAQIKNVVPSSGSFTINLTLAATAETSVGFFVINQ